MGGFWRDACVCVFFFLNSWFRGCVPSLGWVLDRYACYVHYWGVGMNKRLCISGVCVLGGGRRRRKVRGLCFFGFLGVFALAF